MRLFIDKKISAAPIVENGIVIGFISDGDILRHLEGQHTSFKNAWSFIAESDNADFNEMLKTVMQLPIMEIAVKNVVCIDVDTYAGDVCKILVENNLRKAPVIKEGRLIGIINLSNINKYSMNAYLKTIK
ncbi:drug resistance transporter protein [Fibrobacteria bacterium R8-3-H12]